MRWRGSVPSRATGRALGGHYGWNIEKLFSKLKAHLRKAKARTVESLRDAIGEGLRTVSAADIAGWFESCGYRQDQ